MTTADTMSHRDRKIGFTASAFDLLHAGHIAMLKEAKEHCDYLIVGLLTTPADRPEKNRPVQSVFERWMQIQAVKYVDQIVPFESEQDLYDMLLVLQPNIRFVGEEYKDVPHTGKDIDTIELYYNKRRHYFSTTDLRARVYNAELAKQKEHSDREDREIDSV